MAEPLAAVAVVSYREPELLARCLRSLAGRPGVGTGRGVGGGQRLRRRFGGDGARRVPVGFAGGPGRERRLRRGGEPGGRAHRDAVGGRGQSGRGGRAGRAGAAGRGRRRVADRGRGHPAAGRRGRRPGALGAAVSHHPGDAGPQPAPAPAQPRARGAAVPGGPLGPHSPARGPVVVRGLPGPAPPGVRLGRAASTPASGCTPRTSTWPGGCVRRGGPRSTSRRRWCATPAAWPPARPSTTSSAATRRRATRGWRAVAGSPWPAPSRR